MPGTHWLNSAQNLYPWLEGYRSSQLIGEREGQLQKEEEQHVSEAHLPFSAFSQIFSQLRGGVVGDFVVVIEVVVEGAEDDDWLEAADEVWDVNWTVVIEVVGIVSEVVVVGG